MVYHVCIVYMSKKTQRRPKQGPQRTCVVCRRKVDKRSLTRIVRTEEGRVVVDPSGKRNGRGAYLCAQQKCWGKILNNVRLLNQALVVEISEADLLAIATHKPEGNEVV